ncbi:hypothetical protein Q3G72_030721 [Acer saccharum]|nr:hypothetical protein Q3G72_030721 [Acer saccharum]
MVTGKASESWWKESGARMSSLLERIDESLPSLCPIEQGRSSLCIVNDPPTPGIPKAERGLKKEKGTRERPGKTWHPCSPVPRPPFPVRASGSTSSKIASGSAYSCKTTIDKGKEIFKASKALVPKEKEVSVLNKEEVVVAFKRRRLGEGFKCFLALEQLMVSFQEELCLFEASRVDAES